MKLPLDNLCYPVKILIGNSSGSGFFIGVKDKIYLATAKHVVYQQDSITKNSSLFDKKMKIVSYPLLDKNISKTPRIFELDLDIITLNSNLKVHVTADIIVIKLGTLEINTSAIKMMPGVKITQESEGKLIKYDISGSRKFDDVEITNDIFILGYPNSLSTQEMKQIDYDSPLVRKGIVAGKNKINKSLILDCPVYGGNSGGLVLEINQNNFPILNLHLIGIVVQFVPFVDQWRNVHFSTLLNTNLQNSGYSVALPVDYIYDLVEEIAS